MNKPLSKRQLQYVSKGGQHAGIDHHAILRKQAGVDDLTDAQLRAIIVRGGIAKMIEDTKPLGEEQ